MASKLPLFGRGSMSSRWHSSGYRSTDWNGSAL